MGAVQSDLGDEVIVIEEQHPNTEDDNGNGILVIEIIQQFIHWYKSTMKKINRRYDFGILLAMGC